MKKEEILNFIKGKGYKITREAENTAGELSEILKAQNENLDDVSAILGWLEEKKKSYPVRTAEIGIRDLDGWHVHPETGNISHKSGKFFTVMGVKVDAAKGREVSSWTQPMIKQEECGILGVLCKKINGVMHYLLYAKYEPGSIAHLQLSPTLQATDSNLQKAHGGEKTRFAEYFENGGKGKVRVSVVHVEDPSRFYHKTNRCMIVEVDENEKIETPEDYVWLTLPQIKKLLKMDNVVNALARCVFGSM